MTRPEVLIVGAGPAGASLAIRLAKRGCRVALVDRARFPRPKLCGEFLSPDVGDQIVALGLAEELRRLRAAPIDRVSLIIPGGPMLTRPLPAPGLGLSRDRLDHALVEAARSRGVEVHEGCRVTAVGPGPEVELHDDHGRHRSRATVIVDATGARRALAPRSTRRPPPRDRGRWVGLKRNARDAGDTDDRGGVVRMIALDRGYLGIAPIEDGGRSLCLLVDGALLHALGGGEALLAHWTRRHPGLEAELAGLVPVQDRFRGIAGVQLGPRPHQGPAFAIGDAAGMIAPVAGNGVAMALRSASMAVDPILDVVSGRSDLAAARARYRRAWRRAFRPRLEAGRLAQALAVRPPAAAMFVRLASRWPALADGLIRRTRDRVADGGRGTVSRGT